VQVSLPSKIGAKLVKIDAIQLIINVLKLELRIMPMIGIMLSKIVPLHVGAIPVSRITPNRVSNAIFRASECGSRYLNQQDAVQDRFS
jgi:hypothetical protein